MKNLNYCQRDECLKHSNCSVLVCWYFALRDLCQKPNPKSLGPSGNGFLLNDRNLALFESESCCKEFKLRSCKPSVSHILWHFFTYLCAEFHKIIT